MIINTAHGTDGNTGSGTDMNGSAMDIQGIGFIVTIHDIASYYVAI